jgi:aldose 1-epimerase
MTNHSYFNLSGNLSSSVKKHELWLDCPHYTPIDEHCIPTGEIKSVKDTVMDFTVPKKLEEGLDSNSAELKATGGYDHNFCVRDWDGELKKIGSLYEEKSGRGMEVYTDLPGIQIYTGNYLGVCMGRHKKIYRTHGAICMETQYFPNHINEENFVSAVFDKEKPYDSTTIYKFFVK